MWRCTAKNVCHACAVIKGVLSDSSVENHTVREQPCGEQQEKKEKNSELEKGAWCHRRESQRTDGCVNVITRHNSGLILKVNILLRSEKSLGNPGTSNFGIANKQTNRWKVQAQTLLESQQAFTVHQLWDRSSLLLV